MVTVLYTAKACSYIFLENKFILGNTCNKPVKQYRMHTFTAEEFIIYKRSIYPVPSHCQLLVIIGTVDKIKALFCDGLQVILDSLIFLAIYSIQLDILLFYIMNSHYNQIVAA